ncbi:PSP1 domain-containing protein [Veillonella tobetsuensis]|jgi:PSP1 C-terminal domain protein|uniref:Signal peptidase II n=1 Tax=Veillonella tobetsuensis TaxID=1110546 RepID=A0A2S7ZMS6_9FIRM|nr:stage 0 sporulation family protein [Veillonella tobetsuensis]MBF1756269.1 stage 0 sporulation family protein [Veillonella tobetsuensis]PQL24531.1 stage 0 sporulation family protein [Veillonella tobetsuensis]GCL67785.1 signal peptidase II [Veillonella tobetsuensis]GCL68756.1 signal peptidase II [Veillonella tobetsuensis]
MVTIVGVRFKKAGKIYYFLPGDEALMIDDGVIVETARGVEYGTVVIGPKEVSKDNLVMPVKQVMRKATLKDLQQLEKNEEREEKAYAICLEKIAKRRLPMKLINVEYTFDMNKIVFFFTADGRIDFRELVKDLATVFRTRIELRQVGVRDEAKVLNGIGACGRPLCCSNFLGDFSPVSIRMAKDQNLSLNPTKISGVCGRLMCCLNYEDDLYKKGGDLYVKKDRNLSAQDVEPPGIGKEVVTDEGIGKVLKVNHHKHTVKVQLEAGRTIDLKWSDVALPDE